MSKRKSYIWLSDKLEHTWYYRILWSKLTVIHDCKRISVLVLRMRTICSSFLLAGGEGYTNLKPHTTVLMQTDTYSWFYMYNKINDTKTQILSSVWGECK